LLQNTFQYCEPKECFENFRLVSKPWQYAIENMRFNVQLHLHKIVEFEQNGKFPIFYTKYVKAFKQISFFIDENVLMKWNSFSAFILTYVKKLNYIWLGSIGSLPSNFDFFLLQLLQNSQITLNELYFAESKLFHLPTISLPNVTEISLDIGDEYENNISKIDILMQSITNNCEALEVFEVFIVGIPPNIAEYINDHYSDNCIVSNYDEASKIMPTKMSFCSELSILQQFQYPSKIEYLDDVLVDDFSIPFADGWGNYQTYLSICPRLTGIYLFTQRDGKSFDFEEVRGDISQENQDIWTGRITNLESQGIKNMTRNEYLMKGQELRKKNKWGFVFWKRE